MYTTRYIQAILLSELKTEKKNVVLHFCFLIIENHQFGVLFIF